MDAHMYLAFCFCPALRPEVEERDEEGDVAVKVLTLRGMKNWKQLDLFQRETKVLKGLRHPGVPRYLQAGQAQMSAHTCERQKRACRRKSKA